MRNRAYRATAVKQIEVLEVTGRLAEGPVWVGLDIGKALVLCVVRDSAGHFERPWKVKNPAEVPDLVERLQMLAKDRPLVVAMESTGTYGDALRQALSDAGLDVRRVSSKASSDYAEIFDGVPSAHDGKDAAVVAELAAIGKSFSWPLRQASANLAQMKTEVTWLDTQQSILQLWLGQLEGLLSRHWPEVLELLDLNSGTLLRLLAEYGGPTALTADEQAAVKLAGWGRKFLRPEKIQAVLNSAAATLGVRLDKPSSELIQRCATAALAARAELRQARGRLKQLAADDPVVQSQAPAVGTTTACVLRVCVGDPQDYHCGEAYRKAMGLNLKERSSGKHQGKLKITKRGPSLARRWLYFAALRAIQQSPVRAWYEAKKRKDKDYGTGAVVAVMRKLALALHAVTTRGEAFSLERLLGQAAARRAGKTRKLKPGRTRSAKQRTKDSVCQKGLSHSAKNEVSVGGAAS